MAGTQKVQEYLQKHKIGNLFEDLMAKVVSDMPDDPVLYMMQVLERKAALRMGTKSMMRRSMGDLANLKNPLPDKSATWTGGISVTKERPYTKPWQTNTKRPMKKKLSETDPAMRRPKTADDRPGWDNGVKGAETNLDDFWAEGGASEKPISRGRVESPTRGQQRRIEDTDDEELLYHSRGGYTGPRRSQHLEADPLSGELGLQREPARPATGATKRDASARSSGRVRGPAVDAQKHREKLARLIHESQTQADSGYEDDKDLEKDDAVELLEDANELMSEGVKNTRTSGVRVKPMREPAFGAQPQVRVSICARCAKVMEGAVPSEPAEGLGYGQLPDFDIDTDGEFSPESRPQSSARYTDEEFESVSQVSGPRQPVWHTADSDNEVPIARKGPHPFVSSGVPSKGGMFSTKSSLRATVGGPESLDTVGSTRTLKGHGAFNRTWTEGVGLTDDEAKEKEVRVEDFLQNENEEDEELAGKGVTFRVDKVATTDRTTSYKHQDSDQDGDGTSVNLQGTGWAAPPTDYDSDFTVPPTRVARARGRQYQGQY